jgi:hypothetical protein
VIFFGEYATHSNEPLHIGNYGIKKFKQIGSCPCLKYEILVSSKKKIKRVKNLIISIKSNHRFD